MTQPGGAFLVYLIGVPAVGKYTVAKEIARLSGARVVDNQLINLPVFSVLGYDGTDAFPFPKEAWTQVAAIREAVLTVVRDSCAPGMSFVFTNVLEAGDEGSLTLFRRIERIAAVRDAAFIPVRLTCRADRIRERKDSPDRRARFKDIDLGNVDHYLKDVELLEVPHANALTLDTSDESATDVAGRILQHVRESR